MNETVEKELNEYREDLKKLTNIDILVEYKYACIEVEHYRQLVRCNPGYKNMQDRLDYEKQVERICKDVIISRMGGN